MQTSFTLTLHTDESTRKKLEVMTPVDAMFDDARNPVPNEYWQIMENIQPGQSIRITVELIDYTTVFT